MQILNRYNRTVLFDAPDCDNMRDTVLAAIAAGSNLSGSDLRYSDLSGSDLSGSNLHYSNLSGSDLRYSDLSGSDLSGSNLHYSNLSGSNLSGSDLRYSDLSGSNLRGSIRNNIVQSRGPLIITGAEYDAMIWDSHVEIGCSTWSFDDFAALDSDKRAIRFAEGKALINAAIAYKRSMA